jgi:hypothetical protein
MDRDDGGIVLPESDGRGGGMSEAICLALAYKTASLGVSEVLLLVYSTASKIKQQTYSNMKFLIVAFIIATAIASPYVPPSRQLPSLTIHSAAPPHSLPAQPSPPRPSRAQPASSTHASPSPPYPLCPAARPQSQQQRCHTRAMGRVRRAAWGRATSTRMEPNRHPQLVRL